MTTTVDEVAADTELGPFTIGLIRYNKLDKMATSRPESSRRCSATSCAPASGRSGS